MPAIERVIPLVGHLPSSIREPLARRVRELTGLSLITLSSLVAAALMRPSRACFLAMPEGVVGQPSAGSAASGSKA